MHQGGRARKAGGRSPIEATAMMASRRTAASPPQMPLSPLPRNTPALLSSTILVQGSRNHGGGCLCSQGWFQTKPQMIDFGVECALGAGKLTNNDRVRNDMARCLPSLQMRGRESWRVVEKTSSPHKLV